jgi:serine/threonine-protein kinase
VAGASIPPSSTQRLAAGRVVAGRYSVESVVGEGATGVVYVAHRVPDVGGKPGATPIPAGARVALKVIHRHLCGDPQVYRRFEREADVLKRLEGNHIVRLRDVVDDDGLIVLVLDYVDGRSLEAVIRDSLPDLSTAVEIVLQICAALGAAHAAGFVHRDLKPGNVLIEGAIGDGRVPTVWVVDFGLAKALSNDMPAGTALTEQNMILGTPEYMSPEQVRGDEVDRRCDIYAAGVILFELVTGRVPFTGRNAITAMTAHLSEPVPSPRAVRPDRGITPALEAVIMRALAKEPADRYPTARAFAEALAAARDAHHVIAPRSAADSAEDISTVDTELELGKAMPEVRAAVAAAMSPAAARTAPSPSLATPTPEGARPGQASRWVWIVVAVIFAVVAVAIGATFGAR